MPTNNPTKSYLVILRLLKYGISIAGVVVPALVTLKVVDEVDSIKESCETVMRQGINNIDQSISLLEDLLCQGTAKEPRLNRSADII